MTDFKPGDTVRVKSGGPIMTISQVAEDSLGEMTAWCSWFDGQRAERGTFPVTVLVHAEPPTGGYKSVKVARG